MRVKDLEFRRLEDRELLWKMMVYGQKALDAEKELFSILKKDLDI